MRRAAAVLAAGGLLVAAAPAPAADNGRIAYTVVGLRGATIFSVPPSGGAPTKLTAGRAPTWAPDGRTLAFVRGGLKTAVYTASAEGGTIKRLLSNAGAPSYSTDGRRLAFVRNRSLWVAQADGSGARVVYRAAKRWSVDTPVFSPDDDEIAFNYVKDVEAPNPTHALVQTVAAPGSGGGHGRVLNRPDQNANGWINGGVTLSWQPDGDRLLLSLLLGPTGDGIGTGTIPAGGGGTTATITTGAYAKWAPDGRQFCLTGRAGLLRATFGSDVLTTVVKDPAGGAVIGDCAWQPLP